MKHFWYGFLEKKASRVSFKKHSILLFLGDGNGPDSGGVVSFLKKLSFKYPSVKVKIINAVKDHEKSLRHNVKEYPTVLLLKNGREVDRVSRKISSTILEQIFRKAHV